MRRATGQTCNALALALDSIRRRDDGLLEIETPPDPRTGATLRNFDPLDWIHIVMARMPETVSKLETLAADVRRNLQMP